MADSPNDEARRMYGTLFDGVSAILFRHDPVGINFDSNTDEYDPEARTILPRLWSCASEEDALRTIHEEFQRWFDADTAGPASRYKEAATEIWSLWRASIK
jgi:hypothetical protein